MIFTLVIVANFLQQLMSESVPLREIVILFFISNEGISPLEKRSVVHHDTKRTKERADTVAAMKTRRKSK